MPLYTYQCPDCGYTVDRLMPAPPPVDIPGEHPAGDSRILCAGTLKRVYNAALNLGYQAVKHTKNEQWLFTNG